jgi:uncharacterized integral membrane protein
MAEKKRISLKEAAELSGYSPDYLGQLIRSGKLEGEQVFLNVAWMTTEEAVLKYMERGGKKEADARLGGKSLLTPERVSRISSAALWFVLFVLGFFCLILFYVLAVTVDRKLEANYVEKLQNK